MPALTETSSGTRVILLPNKALEGGEAGSLEILLLPHPRTGEGAQYLLNTSSSTLYEILNFREDNRTWFLGDRIVDDGSLLLSTPVDPTFIILPSLIRAERNVPLEDLLDDPKFPHLDKVAILSGGLSSVAKQLGDADLNVWKFDEEKCLSWLTDRVEAVAKVLREQRIDLTGGAASLVFKQENDAELNKVEYRRYSCGIVSEYLEVELSEKLRVKLNLPEPEKPSVKRQAEAEGGPPAKKIKTKEEPVDDYSKSAKKLVKPPVLNSQQKALAKSAVGTKGIMSFFKKK